ncbi:putative non-ribosomal peptide synthetase [Rosellinia necatrix]|uniref:Putative non-ribosomal peptide synthetase n=1 Tax=Rosellinia necatrix TaxID=77044 RepID=A0A1S8A8I7_ROSNE|nr:putative non-ribosomal peptide synthetase [Rosellinia necatrix]
MGNEVMCNLPAFLGKDVNATSLGAEEVTVALPGFHPDAVETSWVLLLHMYTNLTEICFECRNASGGISIKSAKLPEGEGLSTVVPRAVKNSANTTYKGNTAVIFMTGSQRRESDAAIISAPSESTLWPGVDIALCASESSYTLVYRHNFMSSQEARLVSDTFSHIISTQTASNSPQTTRDIAISQQDIDRISQWNNVPLITAETLVHEEFSRTVAAQPNTLAIDSWDGQMTYRDLDEASDLLAGHLRHIGAGPGDWVLLCFTKSRWAIISMLAVLKAGAAFSPVDPRFPELRIRQILQTTAAKHALVCAEAPAELLKRSSASLEVVDVSRVDYNMSYNQGNLAVSQITPRSPAIGLFTSGSTGTPKCIIAPHAAVITGAREFGNYVGADRETRFLQFAAYTFDMSYADIITSLLYGSCLCIPSDDERMGGLQDYIQRVKPTWANLTPTVARMLDPAMSSSIKKLLLAGELVKESDVEGWIKAGVEVHNVYGPAENVIVRTPAPFPLLTFPSPLLSYSWGPFRMVFTNAGPRTGMHHRAYITWSRRYCRIREKYPDLGRRRRETSPRPSWRGR